MTLRENKTDLASLAQEIGGDKWMSNASLVAIRTRTFVDPKPTFF